MRLLIIGGSGQTGSYLAKYALSKNANVFCGTRDEYNSRFDNHEILKIAEDIPRISIDCTDFNSVLKAFHSTKPTHVAFLGGQTSVGLSFNQSIETFTSTLSSVHTLLECIKHIDAKPRFFHASSTEVFGVGHLDEPFTEDSPHLPVSPYGIAKSAATNLVRLYRDAYGLFACSAYLSNHESALRLPRFAIGRLLDAIKSYKNGQTDSILMANLDVTRDWGWAPEFAVAIFTILTTDKPNDFIVSTGHSMTLRELVTKVLICAEIDPHALSTMSTDPRPLEILQSCSNPSFIHQELGWQASIYGNKLAQKLASRALY